MIQRVVLIFFCFLCSSCNKTNTSTNYNFGNNSLLSPTHQNIIKQIVTQSAPKGSSWKGHWIFTVTFGDGHRMREYTTLSRNVLDDAGNFVKSEKVDYLSLKPESFLHAGFITFEDKDKGYDLTGYGKVKLPYTGFKSNGNKLEWDFSWIPVKADNRNFLAQEYHRVAQYDPVNDVIYGTCSMVMYKEVVYNGQKRVATIPIGEYVWKASRLNEKDFQEIAKTGKRNAGMPREEFTVYIDTSHKSFKKVLDEQFNKADFVKKEKLGTKFIAGAGFVDLNKLIYGGGVK